MILGIDANGRSLRWAQPGGNSAEALYSIVGIPPLFSDERFVWNNAAAAGAAGPWSSKPLELAWDRLAYIQPRDIERPEPLRWNYLGVKESSTLDSAGAVADAIAQNIPGYDTAELIAITVPNHLDETGQDDLLGALQAMGLFNVRLLWRPIALAFSWAHENAAQAAALADKKSRSLWVIDLESRGLEITQLHWQRHPADRNHVCPVRSYPRRDAYEAEWASWKWADAMAGDLCGDAGDSKSLLWGAAGSDFQRFLEKCEHGPLVFQDRADPRRWSLADARPPSEGLIRAWTEELVGMIQPVVGQLSPEDHILLHGWPARYVVEALARRLSHPIEISRPAAVADGAAVFAERDYKKLPTYLDTLPRYAIWATMTDPAGQKSFSWMDLNPESVIDAGDEWVLSRQQGPDIVRLREDTFKLARHIDRFALLVQNKTLYDEDRRAHPAANNLVGKRLAVQLPTMMIQAVPLKLEMFLRPASGHAKFTISSKEGLPIFEDKDSIALSWKTAQDEPEHKGFLEAREVVGRIMDKPEYREMARLITRRVQGEILPQNDFARLQVLIDDYRPGIFNVMKADCSALLNRVLNPWGYVKDSPLSQPTRGLWGSRRQHNDPELDEIAREMGEVLIHYGVNGDWSSG